MNTVNLVGNLTKDIELQSTKSGKHVTQFSLAIRRDKDTTDFPMCVAWGKTAELLHQYCHKGSKIGVVGSVQTRKYDSNGRTVYVTEIMVNSVEFLSSGKNNTEQKENAGNDTQNEPQFDNPDTWGVGIDSDDLPF